MAQQIDKVAFQKHMQARASQFEAMLKGSGIDPARFMEIATMAVLSNPKLLQCHINSVLLAVLEAAQDGLMPDGEEGAIIDFNDKEVGKRAVWLPMVKGLRKKIRQSGEVIGFVCENVHEGDDFDYELGDSPYVRHKRRTDGSRKNRVTHTYSIAFFANGFKSHHVMSSVEVDEIRDHYSRSKYGPWSDSIAEPEMRKKTCARAHAKMLPMSSDVNRVFKRLDAVQGISAPPERRLTDASSLILDTFAMPPENLIEGPVDEQQVQKTPQKNRHPPKSGETKTVEEMGRQYITQALSYISQVEDSDELNDWSDRERPNRANLSEDQKKEIIAAISKRMMEFQQNASSEADQPPNG